MCYCKLLSYRPSALTPPERQRNVAPCSAPSPLPVSGSASGSSRVQPGGVHRIK
ncbi:hypothetical protein BC827DRAFT_1253150, partial [Russula dissimulans]